MPSPRSIVVVGNGPLRGLHGTRIDTADFVLRMNRCRIGGFEQIVGTQVHAYATYPRLCMSNWTDSDLALLNPKPPPVWFVRTLEWCRRHAEHADFLSRFPDVPRTYISADLWRRFSARQDADTCLPVDDHESAPALGHDRFVPSTGFAVLRMILDAFADSPIGVVGITGEPERGWYWGHNPAISHLHNWRWEAAELRKLADSGRIVPLA